MITQQEFDKLINQRLDTTRVLLTMKGEEYIRESNPLHNFEVGAKITGEQPTKILDGFLLKHLISYRDMLKDIEDGKKLNKAQVKEKFGDIITYFVIQEIQFLQYSK